MLRPFMEIFFPHDNFLHGNYPPHNSISSTPSPNQKLPLKTSVHFPITQFPITKTVVKVCNLQPLPRGLWKSNASPKIQLYGFSTILNKMAISEFCSDEFGKK